MYSFEKLAGFTVHGSRCRRDAGVGKISNSIPLPKSYSNQSKSLHDCMLRLLAALAYIRIIDWGLVSVLP